MYLIPLRRRAHNTQKAWKLCSEPGSLICVEWGYAAACLSAHHANTTMAQTAFCSTKAYTMPVMKLICSDKRLADCYCSTRDRHSSIAVIRSRTFNGPKRFVAKTSLHLHGQQNLEGNLGVQCTCNRSPGENHTMIRVRKLSELTPFVLSRL